MNIGINCVGETAETRKTAGLLLHEVALHS